MFICSGWWCEKYEAKLKKVYGMDDSISYQVGGFQAMSQVALTVMNDIFPFSIFFYSSILRDSSVGNSHGKNLNYCACMKTSFRLTLCL